MTFSFCDASGKSIDALDTTQLQSMLERFIALRKTIRDSLLGGHLIGENLASLDSRVTIEALDNGEYSDYFSDSGYSRVLRGPTFTKGLRTNDDPSIKDSYEKRFKPTRLLDRYRSFDEACQKVQYQQVNKQQVQEIAKAFNEFLGAMQCNLTHEFTSHPTIEIDGSIVDTARYESYLLSGSAKPFTQRNFKMVSNAWIVKPSVPLKAIYDALVDEKQLLVKSDSGRIINLGDGIALQTAQPFPEDIELFKRSEYSNMDYGRCIEQAMEKYKKDINMTENFKVEIEALNESILLEYIHIVDTEWCEEGKQRLVRIMKSLKNEAQDLFDSTLVDDYTIENAGLLIDLHEADSSSQDIDISANLFMIAVLNMDCEMIAYLVRTGRAKFDEPVIKHDHELKLRMSGLEVSENDKKVIKALKSMRQLTLLQLSGMLGGGQMLGLEVHHPDYAASKYPKGTELYQLLMQKVAQGQYQGKDALQIALENQEYRFVGFVIEMFAQRWVSGIHTYNVYDVIFSLGEEKGRVIEALMQADIEEGINLEPFQRLSNGKTPFEIAMEDEDQELMEILLDIVNGEYVPVDRPDCKGQFPALFAMILHGCTLEFIEACLNKDLEPEVHSINGAVFRVGGLEVALTGQMTLAACAVIARHPEQVTLYPESGMEDIFSGLNNCVFRCEGNVYPSCQLTFMQALAMFATSSTMGTISPNYTSKELSESASATSPFYLVLKAENPSLLEIMTRDQLKNMMFMAAERGALKLYIKAARLLEFFNGDDAAAAAFASRRSNVAEIEDRFESHGPSAFTGNREITTHGAAYCGWAGYGATPVQVTSSMLAAINLYDQSKILDSLLRGGISASDVVRGIVGFRQEPSRLVHLSIISGNSNVTRLLLQTEQSNGLDLCRCLFYTVEQQVAIVDALLKATANPASVSDKNNSFELFKTRIRAKIAHNKKQIIEMVLQGQRSPEFWDACLDQMAVSLAQFPKTDPSIEGYINYCNLFLSKYYDYLRQQHPSGIQLKWSVIQQTWIRKFSQCGGSLVDPRFRRLFNFKASMGLQMWLTSMKKLQSRTDKCRKRPFGGENGGDPKRSRITRQATQKTASPVSVIYILGNNTN